MVGRGKLRGGGWLRLGGIFCKGGLIVGEGGELGLKPNFLTLRSGN